MAVKIRGQAPIPRDAGQNIYYVCINQSIIVWTQKIKSLLPLTP